MPTPLRNARVKAASSPETIDWLGLWAISLGVSAIMLAAVAYFAGGDKFGASFILSGAAGFIALVLTMSASPAPR